jgi:hypothetical protein
MREINGVVYCNDGDWVESRTALVEHFDGRLEIVAWMPGANPETHPDDTGLLHTDPQVVMATLAPHLQAAPQASEALR